MTFENRLPYISNPIEEYKNFEFVSWEKDIYPKFKGKVRKSEMDFFANLIKEKKCKNLLDLGVGGGYELSGIINSLKQKNYKLKNIEANEVNDEFILQANNLFYKEKLNVLIHKGNWIDLPKASPKYTHKFDFAFLTGNSLSYLGGGSREYTKNGIQSIINKFSELIEKDGYLFIDTRNFDYIKSLMDLPLEKILKNFTFPYSVYYHASKKDILVFPAYVSDTVVVLHYYDCKKKIWSKLDYFPIYQHDMLEILTKKFKVEKIYHDFKTEEKKKSLFIQYLVKKK